MKTATKLILAIVFAILVIYDVIAYNVGGNDATISVFALQFTKDWPIAGVLTGIVLGHIFWPQRSWRA